MAAAPEGELAQGQWNARDAAPVYQLGRWYVSGRGVQFMVLEPPRPIPNRPGYRIGPALFRDGRVEVFMWGPETRLLRAWPLRALAWLWARLRPAPAVLAPVARFEAIKDASALPPASSAEEERT